MVKVSFFYADYRLVASTDLGWLQLAFYKLTRLFDQVGLQKNVCKTVGMVFTPCWSDGVWSDEAYTWRMTGEVWSFKGRHRERLLCL